MDNGRELEDVGQRRVFDNAEAAIVELRRAWFGTLLILELGVLYENAMLVAVYRLWN